MAKLGATDVEIAAALKVSLSAVELWARTHKEFLRAVKPAKRVGDDRVERSLFKRATGYSFDSEEIVPYDHIEVTKHEDGSETVVKEKRVLRVAIVKHVAPDTTAQIFWLKNRRRARWRDFKATEISTPPGRPLEFASTGPAEAELIGAYHARLAAATAAEADSPAGADPDPDPGMGEGGQGADRPGGDPPAGQG